MKYLIDTNIFITGHKVHYPMDIHVSYWGALVDQIAQGNFVIIDKVRDEIQDAPLVNWLRQNVQRELYATTADSIGEYSRIQQWAAQSAVFSCIEKSHFANSKVADPYLVAKAMSGGYTIVTYETSVGQGSTKIKIPDVCKAFGVRCISINEALRELSIRL